MQVNEVLDAADNSQRAQYASVSFALNSDFIPNTETGLVPKASILVGTGVSLAEVSWVSSCEQSMSTQFLALIAQPCGPSIPMCLASNISDRYLFPTYSLSQYPPLPPSFPYPPSPAPHPLYSLSLPLSLSLSLFLSSPASLPPCPSPLPPSLPTFFLPSAPLSYSLFLFAFCARVLARLKVSHLTVIAGLQVRNHKYTAHHGSRRVSLR